MGKPSKLYGLPGFGKLDAISKYVKYISVRLMVQKLCWLTKINCFEPPLFFVFSGLLASSWTLLRAVQVSKNTLHFFQIFWKFYNDQIFLGVRIFPFKKIYNDQIYLGVRIFLVKKITTIRFVWVLEFSSKKLQKLVLFLLIKIQTPKQNWSF